MRTIKFRGKRTDFNKWDYGHYSCRESIHLITFKNQHDLYVEGEVIPETVGQFTGLTDKNGKEIYEGDIVKYDDISDLNESFGEVSVVECVEEQGCFDPLAIGFRGCYYERHIENIEVIGNIHDNPELLGGSE